MDVVTGFSHSYASARKRFIEGARAQGLDVDSVRHPGTGRDRETLAVDVVLDGAPQAQRLVVVSSGVHGVEGYCGSGVQVFALQDQALRNMARANGVALLYIHAVNPYGFSYVRRCTVENVDLNRNFLDFNGPLPFNPGYAHLHKLLLPDVWPPGLSNTMKLVWAQKKLGAAGFQAAVSGGQYGFTTGLFFGGAEPTWSNKTIRALVRKYCRRASAVSWIDLHTGLGPTGKGERILCARNDPQGLSDARAIWGPDVTAFFDASTVSAKVSGSMLEAVHGELPNQTFNAIAIEYGTKPLKDVLLAMRAEAWLQTHPRTGKAQAQAIKRQMLDAFFVDTDAWKRAVVEQAREAMVQAVGAAQSL